MNENKKKVSLEDLEPIIREKLNNGGTVQIPITGTSMLPLLVQGRDSVILAPADEVKIGDIIEIAFGERILRVKVKDIKEHTLKNDASELYEVID